MSNPKKETLQKILNALIPYWEPAEGFLLLLNEEWNDELLEKVYQEIMKQFKEIKSKDQQENIKNALQKLKERSESAIKADEDEAEQLLNDFINNI